MTNPKPKQLSLYLAPETLNTLGVIGGWHGDDINLALSSSANLAVQFCVLVCQNNKLDMSPNELLFCCDILNGGAQMTEFKTPDSVNIASAFESMVSDLRCVLGDGCIEVEKWGIDEMSILKSLNAISASTCNLFTLAMATRQFWAKDPLPGFKSVTDAGGYTTWAQQWTNQRNR